MAQLPPIVESLAGIDLKKLVDLVPQLTPDQPQKPEAKAK
jgi:hypothetical protein